MKRLIKFPLRLLWRLTGPLRRPVARKLEAMMARACASRPVHLTCHVNDETGLVMDHLVRELVRLQNKVERLRHAVEDLDQSSGGLGVVHGIEAERVSSRSAG